VSGDVQHSDDAGHRFGWIRPFALVFGVVAVGLQFVPYGWTHSNPPVVQDASWPDAASREVARESCYSCHSNETDWPVYSYVAPMSWLVRSDVEHGREELNFSDWERFGEDADDAIEVIESGEMPPDRYTMVHRGAMLSDEERAVLIDALLQMADDDDGDDDDRDEDE
jgi:hypothetical protein